MNQNLRIIALTSICVLSIGFASTYALSSRQQEMARAAKAPTAAQDSISVIEGQPHIVFRETNDGSQFGRLAMVALDDPGGPRAVSSQQCDRVYATAAHLLCLSTATTAVSITYSANLLDPTTFASTQEMSIGGIPSRARLSADGMLAATTAFAAGDNYASLTLSTQTQITRVGSASLGSLESFTLEHDGVAITPVDRNFWGVTFAADDRTFYVTAAWGGHTYLARGDLVTRRIVTLHEDAECPSLSPDGKHIVFKQRGTLPAGQWRLVEYDVTTGYIVPLAEFHSVDDQAEWLDDSHVIYGLARQGTRDTDDVWEVAADGTGQPTLLIPGAWSPAVVH
jgi:hypothetical protein